MKVERIIFFQGDGANEYLDLLDRKGERAVVKQLMEYWQPGNHDLAHELSAGSSDYQEFIKVDGIEFVLTYNTNLNYIGLEHIIKPPKKKYYLIEDSIYSHITTENPKGAYGGGMLREFDTFTKAKNALIEELHDMYEEYKYALQNARALRKSDFEDTENE